MKIRARVILAGSLAIGTVAATLATSAPAGAQSSTWPPTTPSTVVVAPAVAPGVGPSTGWTGPCAHPNFTAIQPAIEAVAVGGTVVVCKGTYPGLVNVDRQITLAGQPGATIDATGDPYGVGVSASWSVVTGLEVMNASPLNPTAGQLADGIVTIALGATGPAAADHVRIEHNVVTGNLGSGIDINSSSDSTASFNDAHDNGVGINVADDIGLPADNNTITFNTTDENFGGCGIALADHTGVGVRDTLVAFNRSDDNGLATATAPDASAGSGVIMASPVPGGIVSGNRITLNEFSGNGHGGVVVHAHAPGDDFSGNSVTFNRIGTNNLRDDENDTNTTGVYLGSFSPLSIQVAGNLIGPDYYGIFTSGPVTVTGGPNAYYQVTDKLGTAPGF
jgi:parallel beta-helix repeat protein